jgi:hypothetical protein
MPPRFRSKSAYRFLSPSRTRFVNCHDDHLPTHAPAALAQFMLKSSTPRIPPKI